MLGGGLFAAEAGALSVWDRVVGRLMLGALCVGVALFPFSVAVANIALGITLGLSIISGWLWRGWRICRSTHPRISWLLAGYLLLVVVGLIWSIDLPRGLSVLGHHWFWLLLPGLVALLALPQYRSIVLFALSLGMTGNLVFCLLQAAGVFTVTGVIGSGPDDPTGYIGHVGFGVIYAIWAAALLWFGWQRSGWQRWLPIGLGLWAVVMVFATQGRNGYVVMLALIMLLLFRWFRQCRAASWRVWLVSVAMLLVICVIIWQGPAKERLAGTWQAITGQQQAQHQQLARTYAQLAATARVDMWQIAWQIWRDHPLIGVGTGSFYQTVDQYYRAGRIPADAMYGQLKAGAGLAHPHNQYLLNLARWGPLGLILLLMLLAVWIRSGWQMSGRDADDQSEILIFVSGVGLAIAGLFEPSLEEHFSAIFAMLLLACGMAAAVD